MTYFLLPAAIDDLDHIDSWIVSNFGTSAADRARERLFATFARLAQNQRIGIERPDVTSRPVRFFSLAQNWIIYEPGDPLLIHRVFPARADMQNLEL